MTNVIRAANREWAVGLTWTAFDHKPKRPALREEAKQLDPEATWGTLLARPDGRVQAGICRPVAGRKTPGRLYAMAAAIADMKEQPWLGVFKLSADLWWCVAIRRGQAILPEGDVVGDYAKVEAARGRLNGYREWKERIEDGDLEMLLPYLTDAAQRGDVGRIRSLAPISPVRAFGPPAAGLALAVGGYVLWQHHVAAERAARARREAAERARMAREEAAISPLVKSPPPDRWLSACWSVLGQQPLSIDGWLLKDIGCKGRSAVLTWHRADGATVLHRPSGALTDQGNSVRQTIPLGHVPPGTDTAHGLRAGEIALYGLLQPIGVQAKITAPDAQAAPPGARRMQHKPMIPSAPVSFTLPIAPFGMNFNRVPGLRLDQVTRKAHGWSVKGTIYGR